MTEPLLEIDQLGLQLPVEGRMAPVLTDVSLQIQRGEVLGLVGESGSGKSMTARSAIRLLPAKAQVSGSVKVAGTEVLSLGRRSLRTLRAGQVSMIFQDPRAHINPVRRIDDFLVETLVFERGVKRSAASQRAAALLADIGIRDPEYVLRQYPHQLSGGMLQRVMIAAALLLEPPLMLADEPTTALDVTTQSDVLALILEEIEKRDMGMLFITHDLEVAAAVCDRIAVMYAGQIVELCGARGLHKTAVHPYTTALLEARPEIGRRLDRLAQIPGRPLSAFEVSTGCPFRTRCAHAADVCQTRQVLRPFGDSMVACARAQEIRGDTSTSTLTTGAPS